MPATPAASLAITANLDDLERGEDFGAYFVDAAANWAGSTPKLVLVKPDASTVTLTGVVTLSGTRIDFDALGSVTQDWSLGRWAYSCWVLNGGGSRDYLAYGQFTVHAPPGGIPS